VLRAQHYSRDADADYTDSASYRRQDDPWAIMYFADMWKQENAQHVADLPQVRGGRRGAAGDTLVHYVHSTCTLTQDALERTHMRTCTCKHEQTCACTHAHCSFLWT
jgi:hypothetical protein